MPAQCCRVFPNADAALNAIGRDYKDEAWAEEIVYIYFWSPNQQMDVEEMKIPAIKREVHLVAESSNGPSLVHLTSVRKHKDTKVGGLHYWQMSRDRMGHSFTRVVVHGS